MRIKITTTNKYGRPNKPFFGDYHNYSEARDLNDSVISAVVIRFIDGSSTTYERAED